MSLLTRLATKIPAAKTLETAVSKPTRSLDEVRSEIWRLRAEFWCRKMNAFPQQIQAAKAEAAELYSTKLTKPVTWTWGDAAAATIFSVQVAGAFAVGEVVGRGSVIGYNTGDHH